MNSVLACAVFGGPERMQRMTYLHLRLLLAVIVLCAAAIGQSKPAQKHPFGLDDYSALRRAQAQALSPDGKSVLYQVSYGAAKGPEKHEWWLMDISGDHAHKLDLPE